MTDRLNRTSSFAASQEHKQTFLCGVCELDGFSESYPTAKDRQAHYDATGHKAVQAYLDELHTVKRAVREAFPNATEVSESEMSRLAPEYKAPGTKLRGRQYGTADEPASAAQKKFADTLGISVAGLSKKQASSAIDAAKKAAPKSDAPVRYATDKMKNYARKLISEREGIAEVEAIRATLTDAGKTGGLTYALVSTAIDSLKKIQSSANSTIRQTPTPSNSAPEAAQSPSEPRNRVIRITNRYPGKCGSCGQTVDASEGIWQLDDEGKRGVFHLEGQCPLSDLGIPTGRYAYEREGVMKFYVVEPGKIFAQASDQLYPIKKNESVEEIIELIKADTEGGMRRYGIELEHCGRCGRKLTSEWRKQGIGPVCIQTMGWG